MEYWNKPEMLLLQRYLNVNFQWHKVRRCRLEVFATNTGMHVELLQNNFLYMNIIN